MDENHWNKFNCRKKALECKTRSEFRDKYKSAYRCREEALKYTNKKDFRKKSLNHYSACVRNKWLEEVCSQMTQK